MADGIEFRVDTSEWNRAMQTLARTTGVSFKTIFIQECKTLVRKLIRFEYRAKPRDIERQLRERLVVDWGGGNLYNVPREDVHDFARIPNGALRRYRAKRGGKLIEPSGIAKYKRRQGFLASGWGRAGEVLGIRMPKYVTRHNLGRNGDAAPMFDLPGGPRFRMVNKARPGRGSRDKLNTALRIQAGSIIKTVERGLDAAFNRIRPT